MMPGTTNSPPCDDRTRPAVHQPADIGRELLGLGSRQQHAIAQGVQKPRLADPFLLVDDDTVHHRDLPGRAAKAERGDPQPDAQRLAERDAVRRHRSGTGSEGNFGHGTAVN